MGTEVRPAPVFSVPAFFSLAGPMIVSRAGLAAMGIADGVMVARFQSHEFAWLSLAEGTLGRLLDVGVAFLMGGLSLVPRHFAQGDTAGAGALWRRAVPVAVAMGMAGAAIGSFGAPLLGLLRQRPELISGAAPVMAILGAGYPAALVAIASAVYLEGMNRPRVVAASVIFANLLNIFLNWLFIPGMGARGSALSTTLVRCGLCLVLAGFAWKTRRAPSAIVADSAREASRRAQWRLGFGAAGTVAAMVILGASLTVFAGWLGVLPLAVFSASWNLAAPRRSGSAGDGGRHRHFRQRGNGTRRLSMRLGSLGRGGDDARCRLSSGGNTGDPGPPPSQPFIRTILRCVNR